MCQAWTTSLYKREVVGQATALAAGWGNLGGAVSQVGGREGGREGGWPEEGTKWSGKYIGSLGVRIGCVLNSPKLLNRVFNG